MMEGYFISPRKYACIPPSVQTRRHTTLSRGNKRPKQEQAYAWQFPRKVYSRISLPTHRLPSSVPAFHSLFVMPLSSLDIPCSHSIFLAFTFAFQSSFYYLYNPLCRSFFTFLRLVFYCSHLALVFTSDIIFFVSACVFLMSGILIFPICPLFLCLVFNFFSLLPIIYYVWHSIFVSVYFPQFTTIFSLLQLFRSSFHSFLLWILLLRRASLFVLPSCQLGREQRQVFGGKKAGGGGKGADSDWLAALSYGCLDGWLGVWLFGWLAD